MLAKFYLRETEIFMASMGIPAVGQLLMNCWAAAEQAVRRACDDNDEEFITGLFRLELKSVVEAVSASGAVEGAFLHDLQQAFPFATDELLTKIAYGLIASVSFPDHTVEAKTGGDLGILLVALRRNPTICPKGWLSQRRICG